MVDPTYLKSSTITTVSLLLAASSLHLVKKVFAPLIFFFIFVTFKGFRSLKSDQSENKTAEEENHWYLSVWKDPKTPGKIFCGLTSWKLTFSGRFESWWICVKLTEYFIEAEVYLVMEQDYSVFTNTGVNLFFLNSPRKISNHLFIFISLIWVFSLSTPSFLVWLWLTNITSIPPAEGILILYKLWFMFTVTLTLYSFLFLHKNESDTPTVAFAAKKKVFLWD